MDSYFVALGSAIWLGILTSISPCPLATNIAAISYIGKQVRSPVKVLLAGILYIIGRTITYTTIGVLVVSSVLSIPEIALFLQQNMNKFLGPILIIVGFLLLGIFKIKFLNFGVSEKFTKRVEKLGIYGAGLLGLLFALSFCPVSAALFFGSLIPLSIDYQSPVIMPILYTIGTALPVVLFAIFIAMGANFVGTAFDKLSIFEKWARKITAILFIGIGCYMVLVYIFEVQI